MDDIIFEAFKGTGNSELRLTRELADRRIFPAVDIPASSTRREELLGEPGEVAGRVALRKRLAGLPTSQAAETLLALVRRTKTNAELLAGLGNGGPR
jgi:transcription termination factor Rho